MRREIRALLCVLATLPSDVFTVNDAWRAIRREPTLFGVCDSNSLPGAWSFLRARGFLRVDGKVKRGPWTRYYLSWQAVRWLDWTKYPWNATGRRTA